MRIQIPKETNHEIKTCSPVSVDVEKSCLLMSSLNSLRAIFNFSQFHEHIFRNSNCSLKQVLTFKLRILTGKRHPKINSSAYEKYEYGHLGVAGTSNELFLRDSKTGINFPKNKVVSGKNPLFVIGSFCSRHSICLNIGF